VHSDVTSPLCFLCSLGVVCWRSRIRETQGNFIVLMELATTPLVSASGQFVLDEEGWGEMIQMISL